MGITIDSTHGSVLFPLIAIAIQCIFTGFVAGGGRRKAFSKEFMEKHFGEEHKKAFGGSPPKQGYPDMGNGRFSDKLDYKTWYNFNNRQRAHYNFVEQIGSVVALLIVAGIGYPEVSSILGWFYFAGRLLFTAGYVAKGPNARVAGALILDIGLIGLIIVSVLSSLKVVRS